MNRYCFGCKKEIDEFSTSLYCKECSGYSNSGNIYNKNILDYNYMRDHNSKDEWDNQAEYSDNYGDQYDW